MLGLWRSHLKPCGSFHLFVDKLWPGLLLLNSERCHTRDRALPLGTAALGEHLTIGSEDSNTGGIVRRPKEESAVTTGSRDPVRQ
jgi:hypothetical protein